MKELTYLIYIVLWEGMIFGGTGYVVFALDRSGWWFALAILIGGCAYSPTKWMHGEAPNVEVSSRADHFATENPAVARSAAP